MELEADKRESNVRSLGAGFFDKVGRVVEVAASRCEVDVDT